MNIEFKTAEDFEARAAQLMHFDGKEGMKMSLKTKSEFSYRMISIAHNLNKIKGFNYKTVEYNGDTD